MSGRNIVELAKCILDQTSEIDNYIHSKNLPSPSFDISTPPKLALPPHIVSSQNAVLEATDELRAHVLGPVAYLTYQRQQFLMTLKAIQRFKIAQSFPVGTTTTFAQIAKSCSLPESDVSRILRHAMTHYVFAEPTPGVVAHTAASRAFAEVPLVDQMVNFTLGELWPSCSRMVDAMEKWPGSEEPNHTGFNITNQTDLVWFDEIGKYPTRAKRTADAMTFMQSGPGKNIQHLVEHYEWGSAAQGLLVDIGGSQGMSAVSIARRLLEIKCVVQDLPEVISGASAPDDLNGRVTFMAHDFFTEQPVKGADVYHLRWILHDWPDKYATRILQNLIPALKKGAKILVSEMCLPSHGQTSLCQERLMRDFDLSMKALQNSRERNAEEWERLFESADPRFRFTGVKRVPGYDLAIIEVVWDGENDTLEANTST